MHRPEPVGDQGTSGSNKRVTTMMLGYNGIANRIEFRASRVDHASDHPRERSAIRYVDLTSELTLQYELSDLDCLKKSLCPGLTHI